jgi:glycosyltransferase involved in cell wall biosynthesis
MDAPLISVIVPVYKVETYLDRCVQSIVDQTYQNLEIILVDDGSPDNCPPMCDAWAEKDGRIRVIHKENGGVTSARLRGVAEANGAYSGFVDGDDFVEPDMYERLLENALKYDADISHCGYRMVFPSRVDYYHNTGKLQEQDHDAGLRDLICGSFVEPALWNKLYRRALFTGITEKMDFSIKINEDVLMNYWLFKTSRKSVYEDFCPYHYVLRPGSAATSKLNEHKLRDPMKVTKAIFADADEMLRPTALARLARQLIGGASMDAEEQPELVKPYRRECRRELRQRLFSILRCSAVGSKLKLMALFTALCPWGYGLVHQLYARARGLDKIYDIK